MSLRWEGICYKKPWVMMHACNPNTLELEARGSEVQCYRWIYSEFRASLGYMMICLRRRREQSGGGEGREGKGRRGREEGKGGRGRRKEEKRRKIGGARGGRKGKGGRGGGGGN